MIRERLKSKLISLEEKIEIPAHVEVVSAVIVALGSYADSDRLDLVMTKRTQKVLTHKGQISFPGGVKEDADESILKTALRESQEELGISPEHIEVLGRLPAVTTHTTNLLIFPFVGLVKLPYEFKISEDEVERVLYLPLDRVLKEGLPARQVNVGAFKIPSIGIEHDGELIWGASARMIEELRRLLV